MSINQNAHVFRSMQFRSVVADAINFFNTTPAYKLPLSTPFEGVGVYGLYYVGYYDLYKKISDINRNSLTYPIYIGKAVPAGWRTARMQGGKGTYELYKRLQDHSRSIQRASNLKENEFWCRFIILDGIESDLIVPVEAELIRRYKPLWNSVIDGFGNHDPGRGRYHQARSEWDVLHPGRPWADRLTNNALTLEQIREKVNLALNDLP